MLTEQGVRPGTARIIGPMHLIIPFAAPASEAGLAALRELAAPNLQSLLARLGAPEREVGDELSLSPPHERVLAQALGWGEVPDGLVPLAAQRAQTLGLVDAEDDRAAAASGGWGFLTPAHWSLGTEQVSLLDPALLNLGETESLAFFQAVAELFTSEGFELHTDGPARWLCRHPSLAGLPTASLDRVLGRNVDRWLEPHPGARLVRRLQNEVQMLLHEHPLNEARQDRGALPLNSLWLSGTGAVPPSAAVPGEVVLDSRLRQGAVNEDWPGWLRAFAELDAGPIQHWQAQVGHNPAARLTLCGERGAATWRPAVRGGFGAWRDRLGWTRKPSPVASYLEGL